MKVAIFIKNNELTVLNEEKTHVVIFNYEDNKVVGVEHKILEKQSNGSIEQWLYSKSINQVYLSKIDFKFQHTLKAKGIHVKTYEYLQYDKLYNSLALNTPKRQIDLKKIRTYNAFVG